MCWYSLSRVHLALQLVFQSNPGEREVTALCLGGPKSDKSQIYVAHGQIIHGYQKKVSSHLEFSN